MIDAHGYVHTIPLSVYSQELAKTEGVYVRSYRRGCLELLVLL